MRQALVWQGGRFTSFLVERGACGAPGGSYPAGPRQRELSAPNRFPFSSLPLTSSSRIFSFLSLLAFFSYLLYFLISLLWRERISVGPSRRASPNLHDGPDISIRAICCRRAISTKLRSATKIRAGRSCDDRRERLRLRTTR